MTDETKNTAAARAAGRRGRRRGRRRLRHRRPWPASRCRATRRSSWPSSPTWTAPRPPTTPSWMPRPSGPSTSPGVLVANADYQGKIHIQKMTDHKTRNGLMWGAHRRCRHRPHLPAHDHRRRRRRGHRRRRRGQGRQRAQEERGRRRARLGHHARHVGHRGPREPHRGRRGHGDHPAGQGRQVRARRRRDRRTPSRRPPRRPETRPRADRVPPEGEEARSPANAQAPRPAFDARVTSRS